MITFLWGRGRGNKIVRWKSPISVYALVLFPNAHLRSEIDCVFTVFNGNSPLLTLWKENATPWAVARPGHTTIQCTYKS